jgi:serine/threonine-protein kinase
MQDLVKSFLISLVTSVAVLFVLGPIMMRLQTSEVVQTPAVQATAQPGAQPAQPVAQPGTQPAPVAPAPAADLTAPKVIGMTVDDARARWRGQGIAIIEDSQREEQGAKPGEIIEQIPDPGAVLRQMELRVIVAAAAETAAVPTVVGKKVETARELLVAAGFEVPEPTGEESKEPAGTVIRQEPNPGAQAAKGSVIRLFVPAESAMIEVPKLTGKRQSQATTILTEAGLTLGKVSRREHEELSGGRVMGQDPKAGTEVEAGTAVDLVVVAPD